MHKLDLKKKKEDIWQREFSSPIWFIYKRIKKKKSFGDANFRRIKFNRRRNLRKDYLATKISFVT